ncbi:MAG: hypothetical protein ACK5U2_13825 [Microcystis sp.]|nr:hypothetical protein [Microcystis sp. LE17-20D]MCZ8064755.1 hypothetical protein [Microcystis sp. LE17-20D]MCZ8274689.1 hypothetical protein [Microcystis sp. LE19-4.1E]
MTGTNGSDYIVTRDGNDTINGGGGNDTIHVKLFTTTYS